MIVETFLDLHLGIIGNYQGGDATTAIVTGIIIRQKCTSTRRVD